MGCDTIVKLSYFVSILSVITFSIAFAIMSGYWFFYLVYTRDTYNTFLSFAGACAFFLMIGIGIKELKGE